MGRIRRSPWLRKKYSRWKFRIFPLAPVPILTPTAKVGLGPGSPTTVYDPNNGALYMAGASYGGLGYYASTNSIYGSKTEPVDFGSAGNVGYTHGGGAIRIISTGNFVDNGIISADGDAVASGGSILCDS